MDYRKLTNELHYILMESRMIACSHLSKCVILKSNCCRQEGQGVYQALYRKWRPMRFSDVVGQPQVTVTLKKQIASGRLSHAYLFTGTRGTGKTTCAKILSKAANCLNPKDGEPCNECSSCEGINSGAVTDVIEIDAASNSGVDNIRAIREQTVYSPAETRMRVYIIDECHMLSAGAFNALLKTLEEPPPHVLFILATTELHKVPATILSRCQRFNFRRIEAGDIAQRLFEISEAEGIEAEPDAVELIARLADGGMRDATSILDQCAAAYSRIDIRAVQEMMGIAGGTAASEIIKAADDGDIPLALSLFENVYADGADVAAFLGEVSARLRDLLIFRITKDRNLVSPGFVPEDAAGIKAGNAGIMAMIDAVTAALADMQRSQNRKLEAELCILRLCDHTLDDNNRNLIARIERLEQGRPADGKQAALQIPNETAERPEPAEQTQDDLPWEAEPEARPPDITQDKQTGKSPAGEEKAERNAAQTGDDWKELLLKIRPNISMSHYSHLVTQRDPVVEENRLIILVSSEFALKLLNSTELKNTISKVASEYYNKDMRADFLPAGEYKKNTDDDKPGEVETVDRFDKLLELGSKFEDIIVE